MFVCVKNVKRVKGQWSFQNFITIFAKIFGSSRMLLIRGGKWYETIRILTRGLICYGLEVFVFLIMVPRKKGWYIARICIGYTKQTENE